MFVLKQKTAYEERISDWSADVGSSDLRALRLYEAWIDQKIGDAASVRIGLYDLNSEFDALDTAGFFVSSPHGIGPDFAQSGRNGPSIFPAPSLAARVAISPAPGWTVRAALLDGVPGHPDHPPRTAPRLGLGPGAGTGKGGVGDKGFRPVRTSGRP